MLIRTRELVHCRSLRWRLGWLCWTRFVGFIQISSTTTIRYRTRIQLQGYPVSSAIYFLYQLTVSRCSLALSPFVWLFCIYFARPVGNTLQGYSIYSPPAAQHHIHPPGMHIQCKFMSVSMNILSPFASAQLWRITNVLPLRLPIQWIGTKRPNTAILEPTQQKYFCTGSPKRSTTTCQSIFRLSFTHRGCLLPTPHFTYGRPSTTQTTIRWER